MRRRKSFCTNWNAPTTVAKQSRDAVRPLHAVRIDVRTLRYQQGVVEEWRWWCVCGAVGAWTSTRTQAARDSEVHLAMRPATADDLT